jgi:hypothetical protein
MSAVRQISRDNPMSYSQQRNATNRYQPYPREAAILAQAEDRLHRQDNLHMIDMVFANAIQGLKILKEPSEDGYNRLKAHIERGLFDIGRDELPMATKGERLLYKYVAGGQAMLLEYCSHLNTEVRRPSSGTGRGGG